MVPQSGRKVSSVCKIDYPCLVVAGLGIVTVFQVKQIICSFIADRMQWFFWVISHMSMEFVFV